MVLIDIVIVLIGVFTLGYFYIKHNFNYWNRRGVSQLEPSFPTGSYPALSSEEPAPHRLVELYQHFKKNNQIFGGIYHFLQPMALITDLDLVKSILLKDFSNFMNRGLPFNERDDPLSAHLGTIEGPKWKYLRSKLTPTFSSGKMKMMFPIVVSVADEMTNCLSLESETNSDFEMKDLLARYTTDVIGTCVFGVNCNSLKNPEAEFRAIGKKMFEVTTISHLKIIFAISFRNLIKKFRLKIIPAEVSTFFLKVVKDTVDYREKNIVERNDFMNLLIQLKNNGKLDDDKTSTNTMRLTFNEIAAQAVVFFVAGFETSSTVMTFALYELCQNLEVQEKGRQEVIRVLKEHDNEFTYESVMEMKYIDQIINESLRKYPPIHLIKRKVEENYKVPNSNQILEKGVQVGISLFAIHHDPEYYPDPYVFDPERFTNEMVKSRIPYTFMPFGEGPRNCVAIRFGLMQAKIGLAKLLLNFKFSNSSKSVIPLRLSTKSQLLAPISGLYLKIEKV